MTTSVGPAAGRDPMARRIHALVLVLLVAGAALVVGLSEGGLGWGWTGFGDNQHLWDWLHLLVLPIAVLLMPFWIATHRRHRRAWLVGLALLAAAFVVLVVGGYRLGWEWTGFSDNHLWDWLELLVLPLSVALIPVWLSAERGLRARHVATAVLVVPLFAVVVVCGYAVPWGWTGFTGNTLWDWIQLFIVPFAIPVTVVVVGVLTARGAEGA